MIARLVHRNTRNVPWVDEKAMTLLGEQDLTGHDIGSRTSKSSSLSEETDNMILSGYCGAKGIGNLSSFHIKPTAHVEEKEMFEDEQRKFRPLGYAAEDNPVIKTSANRDHERGKYCHRGESPRQCYLDHNSSQNVRRSG